MIHNNLLEVKLPYDPVCSSVWLLQLLIRAERYVNTDYVTSQGVFVTCHATLLMTYCTSQF